MEAEIHKLPTFEPSNSITTSGRANIGVLFSASARAHGTKPALVEVESSLTYAELDERSGRVAACLLHNGLEAGDRIEVLARNCSDYLVLELAAAKSGIIIVALGACYWLIKQSYKNRPA